MRQLLQHLDKAAALLGIITGFVLTMVLRENYPEPGIALVLACVVYLAISNKVPQAFSPFTLKMGSREFLVSNIVFFTLFTYSMVAVIVNFELYLRPIGYFIATSLIVALMAVEILTSEKPHPYFTLFKILLIGISLQWVPQAMFPSLTGVDVFGHSRAVSAMLSSGHIPPEYVYARLPMMPLVLGMTSLVSGLDYKFSGMLSIGLFYLAASMFVFLIGARLFNTRIALLSALMVVISDWFILNGLWVIPNTMGIALVIFLTGIVFRKKERISFTSAIFLIMAILIMTHPLASFALSIILISIWFGIELYHRQYHQRGSLISITTVTVFAVATLSYWMYVSGQFWMIAQSIETVFGLDRKLGGETEMITAQYLATVARTTSGRIEILLDRSGFLLFFFLSIVGILATLSKRLRSPDRFCFILAAVASGVIAFLGMIGFSNFVPQRFMAYSEVLLSLPAALGIILLANVLKKGRWRLLMLSGFTVVLSLFLITNSAANRDSPIYSQNVVARTSFTLSEVQAAETISQIYEGNIFLGLPYDNLFTLPTSKNPISANVRVCFMSRDFRQVSELIPIRKYEVEHLTYGFKLDYDPRIVLEEQGFCRIYDCGTVSAFLPGGRPPPGK